MELVRATVNDLPAQVGPGDGHMYLSGDLNPQILTDPLDGCREASHALVHDGVIDPTMRRGPRLSSLSLRAGR